MPNRRPNDTATILVVFLVIAIFVATPFRVRAQVSGATLTGTVSDSTGAVIPKAQVSIRNQGTGETRSARSGARHWR